MVLTAFNAVAHSPLAMASAALQPTYSLSRGQRIPTTGNPSLGEHDKRQITPTASEFYVTTRNVKVLTYTIADVPPTFSLSQRRMPTLSPVPTHTAGTPVPMSMESMGVHNSECTVDIWTFVLTMYCRSPDDLLPVSETGQHTHPTRPDPSYSRPPITCKSAGMA